MCAQERIVPLTKIECLREHFRPIEFDGDEQIDAEDLAFLDRHIAPGDIIRAWNWTSPQIYLEESQDEYQELFSLPAFQPLAIPRERHALRSDGEGREVLQFVTSLIQSCRDIPYRVHDAGMSTDDLDFETWQEADADSPLGQLLRRHLPERVTFNRLAWGGWLGQEVLLSTVMADASRAVGLPATREFLEWEPWIGELYPVVLMPDQPRVYLKPFLGPAQPGRLIWMPPDGVPLMREEEGRNLYVLDRMQQAERVLVRMAERITGYLAHRIIYRYVIPQMQSLGHTSFDRDGIEMAVRRILGERWFDVPFDTAGDLSEWNIDRVLLPDEEIEIGTRVFVGE